MSSPQPYYVPESSKLPFAMAVTMLVLIVGASITVKPELGPLGDNSYLVLLAGFLMMWTTMFFWFSEVIRENNEGLNNNMLNNSYYYGMAWFIFSEVMFFFAFFLALGYIRMFAVPWLGGEGEKGIANMLWPGFEAHWPLMITPDQAVFPGPAEEMSLSTAYSSGGLAGVLSLIHI